MKFQFQFAGASVSRAGAQQRKLLRMGILLCLLVLAALAYGHYLYRVTHGKIVSPAMMQPAVAAPAAAAVTVAIAAPAAAPVPAPVAESQTLPPALKRAADAGAAAIGTMLVKTVNVSAPAPVPKAEPVQAPAIPTPSKIVVTPAPFKVVPMPTARPPTKVLTPEQQLARAGKAAMDKMLMSATKYPDAYGFVSQDVFEDVKLGTAIPVYAISEKDRASYKQGQPIEPLLRPVKQWVFPVLADGRLCCMVQVSHNGYEYVPGSASKALAEAWSKISQKWPAEAGYNPKLIVNHGIPGYYFTVPEEGSPNITDTVQMFYYHPSLSPADVILASWR